MRRTTMFLVLSVSITALVVLALGFAGALRGHPAYEDARFSYTSTPSNVVLHVTRGLRGNTESRSMTLYGDSRLVLEHREGPKVVLRQSRYLDSAAVHAWLRECVDHGLIDWDQLRIRAFHSSHLYGESPSPPGESDDVTVLLSLESYRHGDVSLEKVEKAIRIAPLPRDVTPDTLEYQGIQRLLSRLRVELEKARMGTAGFIDAPPRERLYKEVEVSYDVDPDKVLLQVVHSSMDMHVRSMALHADGRLHVEDKTGPRLILKRTRNLNAAAVEDLLREGLDYGLAEWDETRIRSGHLRQLNGRFFHPASDGDRILVTLRLKDYRRGSFFKEKVEKEVRIQSLTQALRYFPEIVEYQGVDRLLARLWVELEKAEKESEK